MGRVFIDRPTLVAVKTRRKKSNLIILGNQNKVLRLSVIL